jgi:hypothetical protein
MAHLNFQPSINVKTDTVYERLKVTQVVKSVHKPSESKLQFNGSIIYPVKAVSW